MQFTTTQYMNNVIGLLNPPSLYGVYYIAKPNYVVNISIMNIHIQINKLGMFSMAACKTFLFVQQPFSWSAVWF